MGTVIIVGSVAVGCTILVQIAHAFGNPYLSQITQLITFSVSSVTTVSLIIKIISLI
jgi:hypothetical protein